jgi:hypothetical protein
MASNNFSGHMRCSLKPAHDIPVIPQYHQNLFSLHIEKVAQAAIAFKSQRFLIRPPSLHICMKMIQLAADGAH